MIKDFNESDIDNVIETDICIIGAGAAGITIAHKLIDSGLNITMLESGALQPDAATLDLNKLTLNKNIDANVGGTIADPNSACRLRYFGGTTNHWAGWCRPLDEIDFKVRDWVPGSGWPITLSDLSSYYDAAEPYCDLRNPFFDIAESGLSNFPAYSAQKIESIFWAFSSPTRFGQKYRAELEAAQNVDVILNANAVEIVTDSSESTVQTITLRSLQGKQASINAKQFIVATGALENTRLLLTSNKVNPDGVGNQSGMVGKNYQNHPHLDVGTITAADGKGLAEIYARQTSNSSGGSGYVPGIAASEAIQADKKILNFGATIQKQNAKSTLRTMWNDVKRFNWPDDFASKMKMVVEDLVAQEQRVSNRVYMYTEQAPNNNSQIVLTDEQDALGMPRIRMDWQLNELDMFTVRQASMVVAEEIGRLDIGRLKLRDWVAQDDGQFPSSLWGGCHQIGTTRMSESPDDGVVDKNCRVHGVDNLYMAGSSVFPTGGHAPPTFTIVALALRLADHISNPSTEG